MTPDFSTIQPDVPAWGHGGRGMGNVPQTARRMFSAPMADDDLIPETRWVEFDLRDEGLPLKTKNQNGYGACNGHATASTMEGSIWLAGLGYVPLSAWFPYAILCGGWDVGSNISEALQLLSTQGTCREELVPWGTINPHRLSTAAKADAANYRVEIGAAHTGFASIMTATQRRQLSDVSLDGDPMNSRGTDGDGCIPRGTGRGNHALSVGYGAKKINGVWHVLGLNSWDVRWGMKGFFWFDSSNITGQRGFDGYVIKGVLDVPGSPLNPPRVSA